MEHNVRGERWKSRLIVMLYVDDLLFAGSTVEVIEHVKCLLGVLCFLLWVPVLKTSF